jgi:NAD(P)-dependent dehydrogenase (short-subunit alcohol dehydrogenase family)
VCADLNEDTAKETATLCQKAATDAMRTADLVTDAYPIDVRDETDVNALMEKVKEMYGRLDVFVNTAGVSHFDLRQSLEKFTLMTSHAHTVRSGNTDTYPRHVIE